MCAYTLFLLPLNEEGILVEPRPALSLDSEQDMLFSVLLSKLDRQPWVHIWFTIVLTISDANVAEQTNQGMNLRISHWDNDLAVD